MLNNWLGKGENSKIQRNSILARVKLQKFYKSQHHDSCAQSCNVYVSATCYGIRKLELELLYTFLYTCGVLIFTYTAHSGMWSCFAPCEIGTFPGAGSPIEVLTGLNIVTCVQRKSTCDIWSPESHSLTNKCTLKLGHIANWGHQFHLQTQF